MLENLNEHENNDNTKENILLDNAHKNNHHHMHQKRPDLKRMCKNKHICNTTCFALEITLWFLDTHHSSVVIEQWGEIAQTKINKNKIDLLVKWVRCST